MQADFTHVRRGRDPLLAFVATLGYGRSSFVRFTTAEDATTLCTCLRKALIYFCGVPAHVLFENLAVAVHSHTPIVVARRSTVPIPYDSLQHPLSVHDALLEVA
jgi:transposase